MRTYVCCVFVLFVALLLCCCVVEFCVRVRGRVPHPFPACQIVNGPADRSAVPPRVLVADVFTGEIGVCAFNLVRMLLFMSFIILLTASGMHWESAPAPSHPDHKMLYAPHDIVVGSGTDGKVSVVGRGEYAAARHFLLAVGWIRLRPQIPPSPHNPRTWCSSRTWESPLART